MFDITKLMERVDKFIDYTNNIVLKMSNINIENFFPTIDDLEAFLSGFTFYDETNKFDVSTLDPSTGEINLNEFLQSWKKDIETEYNKNLSVYNAFVESKKSLMNDIMTKMVAAEKAMAINVKTMDDVFEYRTNTLNSLLITSNLIEMNEKKLKNIDVFLSDCVSDNSLQNEKIREVFDINLNKFVLLLNEYITLNLTEMDKTKEKIETLDQYLTDIVKLVSTTTIFVNLSPGKRKTAISGYALPEKEIAETFMGYHAGRSEKDAAKSMRDTLTYYKEKNKYETFFTEFIK